MATAAATKYTPRLKNAYKNDLTKQLMDELKLKNVNEVPKLEKIIISSGLGRAKDEKRVMEVASNTISKITGQRPVETIARKSIASFKLREGNKVGIMVTLRDERMYEFADRFINIVLPRLRDFHGVSAKSFDNQGNYSVGLTDQSVFAELSYEDTATAHGLQVTFVINSKNPEHTRLLLEKLGMPFERSK
jgi:large subunit ribosomal protein L5